MSIVREWISDCGTVRLVNADCIDAMRAMPDASVDSVVTDPPYGLAFMGKRWDYDVPSVDVWAECLRVLRPGGHLLAFAGTRTQHRMAVRIEDAGFEIRDMIAWVYGSGFPKSHNGEWGGTALKPAMEPVTVARKPLIGTVAANFAEHGTGGLNIDGCRVGVEQTVTIRNGNSGSHGRYGRDNRVFARTNPPGRWPANLIHDGSEEVVGMFPVTTSKRSETPQPIKTSKGIKGGSFGNHAARKPEGHETHPSYVRGGFDDSGSAARFFYCAKASKRDRDEGLNGFEEKRGGAEQFDSRWKEGTGELRQPVRKNAHPTVKPTDLMRYLCKLVTPPGGKILDPFAGSGSTGKGAAIEGFQFVGIEREAEYYEIAKARIASKLAAKSERLIPA